MVADDDDDALQNLAEPIVVARNAFVDYVRRPASHPADRAFGPVNWESDMQLDDDFEDIVAGIADDLSEAWGDSLGDDLLG